MKKMSSFLHFLYWVCMGLVLGCGVVHSNVIYDRKALIIDGQRRILFSGSIHYTRSTPEMWEDLINKAREGGIDVIQTYVFWNVHEPTPGNYNFEGRYDLVKFVKTIQKAGLYAHLRIGPYICAEWNFGGFPVWLKFVPGISFRTDNEPFKMAMQGFTEKIVNMMKSEKLYESQGGPIILSQIENEYGPQEGKMGSPGRAYATWAANMAVGLDTGVPWVMCKENDAPDPVINTCNGFYCNNFSPNRPNKPLMWTEAWTGWFTEFGGPMYQRPVEDLAFAVASFVQKGGAFVNYYMYHGGTNFGRSAGGSYITTSYDYDAPLDEYGLIRQPKYGHLKELHMAVKQSERALTSADPTVTSLGSLQEAHVYTSESGDCAAFLANYDTENRAMATFKSKQYNLPPWSISILPDCQTEAFNTAKVGVQTSHMEMISTNTLIQSWQTYNEDVYPAYDDFRSFSSGLMEQINITRDITDYLWYKTSVEVDVSESFLKTQELPTLVVHSMGDGLHVFVNGELIGSAFGTKTNTRFTFTKGINLHAGTNVIALLSVAIGLPNVGIHFEEWSTGVLGPVVLEGFNQGRRDLSWSNWTYQVGLRGEDMSLFAPSSDSSIDWTTVSLGVQNLPLSWYKGYFDAPEGDEPLALDMSSMGKGQIWINGQSLGRYWTINSTGNCSSSGCGYTGIFRRTDCQVGCGQATQRWYHLPRPWLKPTENLLVIYEEVGGDPTKVTVSTRSLNTVCADVSEYHPNNTKWQTESYHQTGELYRKPMAHLNCGSGKSISSIEFASFGTPVGKCGSFLRGDCHASKSNSVIEQSCIGKQRCSVAISNMKFGEDPCPNVLKRLSVEARCGPSSP